MLPSTGCSKWNPLPSQQLTLAIFFLLVTLLLQRGQGDSQGQAEGLQHRRTPIVGGHFFHPAASSAYPHHPSPWYNISKRKGFAPDVFTSPGGHGTKEGTGKQETQLAVTVKREHQQPETKEVRILQPQARKEVVIISTRSLSCIREGEGGGYAGCDDRDRRNGPCSSSVVPVADQNTDAQDPTSKTSDGRLTMCGSHFASNLTMYPMLLTQLAHAATLMTQLKNQGIGTGAWNVAVLTNEC